MLNIKYSASLQHWGNASTLISNLWQMMKHSQQLSSYTMIITNIFLQWHMVVISEALVCYMLLRTCCTAQQTTTAPRLNKSVSLACHEHRLCTTLSWTYKPVYLLTHCVFNVSHSRSPHVVLGAWTTCAGRVASDAEQNWIWKWLNWNVNFMDNFLQCRVEYLVDNCRRRQTAHVNVVRINLTNNLLTANNKTISK